MYKQLKYLLLIGIFVQHGSITAQLKNRIFEQNDTLIAGDTQTVRLNIEAFNYLRNTEYFDLIEKGQTLFGSMFQAHVTYQPRTNILLKGGLQTRQDYGSPNFVSVEPVLCISIFKDKWRYNIGMLQGTTNYGFIEPMYNIDRAILNRIENGLQGIYRSEKFYFNNFLVWNEPTYRTTSNQERFVTGLIGDRLLLSHKGIRSSLPFQATLAHRGGELNGNPTPIYTRINTALGYKLSYLSKSGFEIRTENHWLFSVDVSPNITQPYKNGNASWHSVSFGMKGVELMFNYWAGREWQSPLGTQIYNNYNFYNVYEHRRVRHMFMSRLLISQTLTKGVMLDARFEPFYDQEYAQIQYSYSFYLKVNMSVFLGRIKNTY